MQSEVVLAYSKDPSDPSAWRRVGVAIRMGFQLFFHVNRFAPLPEDRHVARLILVRYRKIPGMLGLADRQNAERTWYCIFCK